MYIKMQQHGFGLDLDLRFYHHGHARSRVDTLPIHSERDASLRQLAGPRPRRPPRPRPPARENHSHLIFVC